MKRLEQLEGKKNKIKSKEKLLKFKENLEDVKKQVIIYQKSAEQVIDSLDLTVEEKELAKNYYVKNMSWSDAYSNSTMRMNLSSKSCESDFETSLFDAKKKQIYRIIDEGRLSR